MLAVIRGKNIDYVVSVPSEASLKETIIQDLTLNLNVEAIRVVLQ